MEPKMSAKILLAFTKEQKDALDNLNKITGVPTTFRLRKAIDDILKENEELLRSPTWQEQLAEAPDA